jgi:uncharacterized protein involved in exopolysaccharide biosynthesis
MAGGAQAPGGIGLSDVFEILGRWRWWIVVGAILGLLTGFGAYLVLPPRYQATTTILVEPQEVPKSYVESTVTLEIEQRLNTIQERVASHSNLTQLIELVGQKRLDPTGRLGTDEILSMIRSQLAVDIRARSDKTAPVFDIAFTHADPAVAADVVRDVTGRFIDENLKDRAQQATATAEFLDVELQRLRDDVTKQEERIRQFRMEKMGALPSQLETNLRSLDRLNVELASNLEAQEAGTQRLALLRQQRKRAGWRMMRP